MTRRNVHFVVSCDIFTFDDLDTVNDVILLPSKDKTEMFD